MQYSSYVQQLNVSVGKENLLWTTLSFWNWLSFPAGSAEMGKERNIKPASNKTTRIAGKSSLQCQLPLPQNAHQPYI